MNRLFESLDAHGDAAEQTERHQDAQNFAARRPLRVHRRHPAELTLLARDSLRFTPRDRLDCAFFPQDACGLLLFLVVD